MKRFVAAGMTRESISFKRGTHTFNHSGTPSEFLDAFRNFYGPTMNAYEAARKSGRIAELHADLGALFNSQKRSAAADVTSIPATFLMVTVAAG
jgi:hypothetical protein